MASKQASRSGVCWYIILSSGMRRMKFVFWQPFHDKRKTISLLFLQVRSFAQRTVRWIIELNFRGPIPNIARRHDRAFKFSLTKSRRCNPLLRISSEPHTHMPTTKFRKPEWKNSILLTEPNTCCCDLQPTRSSISIGSRSYHQLMRGGWSLCGYIKLRKTCFLLWW